MKFRSTLILLCLSLALGACSLADDITPPPGYRSPTPAPTMGPLFPARPPDVATGALIFAEKCAPCHGATGLGDGPSAANLPKQPTALGKPEIADAAVPAAWYMIVTQGKIEAFMPPFNSLDDQQRWDVVAYALSLSVSAEQLAQGKTVYETNCAECHGIDGRKSAQSNFSDQALISKLSRNDLLNFINRGVDGTDMPAYEGKLGQTERYAVAAYVRSFSFAAASASLTPEPATVTDSSTPTVAPTAGNGTPSDALGTIRGKVTNSPIGPLPPGLKAVLHVFEHDAANDQFSEIDTQEVALDAGGNYIFTELPIPASRAFFISVDYAGTTYSSDALVPQAGQSEYELPITIYETTTDVSGLLIDEAHILLDYSKEGVIQVVEYYVISNPGNKTVIADEDGGPVVTMVLPMGYANLQLQDGQLGDRFLQTANGFADTTPVMPGNQQSQIIFAFDLPDSNNLEFNQPFPLDVSDVTFLVSEGVKAEGQNMTDSGIKDMGNGGGKFQMYNAGTREAGEALTVRVSAGQAGAGAILNGEATRYLLVGVLALALVLGVVWWSLRQRSRVAADNFDDEEDAAGDDTDEILDAIIALDDQFNAGNIAGEAYRQRRAGLKARLKGKAL